MGGTSNFVNLNNLGVISTRSRYQGKLAELIVKQIKLQSDIGQLSKIHTELTKMWRSIKVNKTNFDKITNQQRTKRYNNATNMINQIENQRNKVSQSIDKFNKKLEKIKKKIKNVKNTIRYYST